MNCKNCARRGVACNVSLATLVAAAFGSAKIARNIDSPQSLQSEMEAADVHITLIFVGDGEVVNLSNAANFRVPLLDVFAVFKPGVAGKDQIPPGTFMADDDIETAIHLMPMSEFFDPLVGFNLHQLAEFKGKDVMVMDAVNNDGAAVIGTNGVVMDLAVDDGVQIKKLDVMGNGDPAWTKTFAQMLDGNPVGFSTYIRDVANGATGNLSSMDSDTGWPAAGPLAAAHEQNHHGHRQVAHA